MAMHGDDLQNKKIIFQPLLLMGLAFYWSITTNASFILNKTTNGTLSTRSARRQSTTL